MQGTLVVPGRQIQGRRALGQFFYQVPEAKPRKDVDRTYSAEELSKGLVFDTADQALNFYKTLLYNFSIRSKVAFLTDLWKKIKASPEMTGVLAAKEEGRAWLDIFWKSESTRLAGP